MKFNFVQTFVVPLCEGSLIHKYMHCSGEWSLLFRSVGEDLKVVEFHPPGAVVKVRAFADAVKQKMVDDEIITKQQKVKSG